MIAPGVIIKCWSIDTDKMHSHGIVLQEKNADDKSLPPFWEILWDDGTVSGEFEDELEIVETNAKKLLQYS